MRNVFISYRHESEAHAAAVRALAEKLREAHLPVELDQFYLESYPGGPDETWPKWCRDRATQSECVLVVASSGWFEAYDQKGEPGKGLGAAEEARIFNETIYGNKGLNPRIRFVLLDSSGSPDFPPGLNGWHKFNPDKDPRDLSRMTDWIRQRLSIPSTGGEAQRFVYLAALTDDPDDLRAGLAEDLTSRSWTVLPAAGLSGEQVAARLNDDLSRSAAFIQILETTRGPAVPTAREQHDAAIDVGIPRLRFRDPDLDLAKVTDPEHRNFLTADPTLCVRQFDEFKKELFSRLEDIWERQHNAPEPPSRDQPSLVRVVIWAREPQARFDTLFDLLDADPDIIHDVFLHYDPEKTSLASKHRTKPCHGFIFACDSAALESISGGPERALEECQEIQLGIKDSKRCPPVGMIYWPPPEVAWSRLLLCKPTKLHRFSGEIPAEDFKSFLSEVKEANR